MRKVYIKPEVTRVNLAPSEAVLSSCKDLDVNIGPDSSGDPCVYWIGYSCKESGS